MAFSEPNWRSSACFSLRTHARNLVEPGLKRRFAPFLPVKRDGKAVRFVSHPLHEEQRLRISGQDNRRGAIGNEQFLIFFCQRHDRLFGPACILQTSDRGAELPLSTVDDDQSGTTLHFPSGLSSASAARRNLRESTRHHREVVKLPSTVLIEKRRYSFLLGARPGTRSCSPRDWCLAGSRCQSIQCDEEAGADRASGGQFGHGGRHPLLIETSSGSVPGFSRRFLSPSPRVRVCDPASAP